MSESSLLPLAVPGREETPMRDVQDHGYVATFKMWLLIHRHPERQYILYLDGGGPLFGLPLDIYDASHPRWNRRGLCVPCDSLGHQLRLASYLR